MKWFDIPIRTPQGYRYDRTKTKEKELKDYECGFCGHKFQQYVRKAGKKGEAGTRGDASSQVMCRRCGNFLKTWQDER